MNLNNNIFPKTGFLFKDADGVKHVADSWTGVVARVKAYRKRRGVAEGNVEAEVVAQACAREPIICQQSGEAHALAVKKTTLKSRIISWLTAVRTNTDKRTVEESLARQRADICARCPKQEHLPGGCASCTNAVMALRKEILGNRFIDGRLHECSVLGEDNPVTVHIDMIAVDNPELPGHCWRKRTL
jgi:hypothetical protein